MNEKIIFRVKMFGKQITVNQISSNNCITTRIENQRHIIRTACYGINFQTVYNSTEKLNLISDIFIFSDRNNKITDIYNGRRER